MTSSWIWLLVIGGLVVGVYVWYAVIVARPNKVREALSSVDVHLNQRHDLAPNIVKLAARFMEHERGLIEEVTRLRRLVDSPLARAGRGRGALRARGRAGAAGRPAAGDHGGLPGAQVRRAPP